MRILARTALVASGVVHAIAAVCAASPLKSDLPKGFVYLRDLAPSIVQDIRYASSHNFIGRPIPGYGAPECILTVAAAQALSAVQTALAARGLSLIAWDCYRPTRAVATFVRWTGEAADQRMKAEFYPNTDKRQLLALGYVAAHSGHSRGSTVDVGIVPASLRAPPPWDPAEPLKPCTASKDERFEDGTVDLGTGYDCLDDRARYDDAHVGTAARANRMLLHDLMVRAGFAPYWREWWHFTLTGEPFPDTAFDFPIEPPRAAVEKSAIPFPTPGAVRR